MFFPDGRGHAELAQDLIHGQITINFTRKRHTIEHHIWPHTDDAPNIDAVMSWCGARAVKTTHVEFRRQNVCTAAGRIERPQLLHESHMFLTILRNMPRF